MDDTTTGLQPGPESERGDAAPGASEAPAQQALVTATGGDPVAPAGASADPGDTPGDGADSDASVTGQARRRRRGSRGGQARRRPSSATSATGDPADDFSDDDVSDDDGPPDGGDGSSDDLNGSGDRSDADHADRPELPERMSEGRVSDPAVAAEALVRKPKIGDTRPAAVPPVPPPGRAVPSKARVGDDAATAGKSRRRRRGGRGRGAGTGSRPAGDLGGTTVDEPTGQRELAERTSVDAGDGRKRGRRGGRPSAQQSRLEQELIEQRAGRERNGKPVGRYFMAVQVRPGVSQVAVLEGRNLIEHYVSRPADDVSQIHGNVYLGRVQNVLPGMEAAFVDIATPKNAVLYRGDVQYDAEDVEVKGKNARIEDILRNRQMIMCQVTKNPIGAKGARLTQEISLPGRFVVLIPNSKTYGISKRLADDTRKRLRNILDRVKPDEHGLIVRTAAEHATEADLEADMRMLLGQWAQIEAKAAKAAKPGLLYREPELAVRVIREEFNPEYRGVVIDDRRLYEEVRDYVRAFNPELADRVEFYDTSAEGLSLFERFHIHEQVHKALDRKVWLPSGGSLIIEHTEALTVIDVNTGKNVGKSNLEETVFHNNLEAAEEIAKQLRLRDIGGIIVIDFIDMEVKDNRANVVKAFREALGRDKTRTQVFDISDLGLCEMTRKRIGEGLLTEFSETCPECEGRGVKVDYSMLE